VLPGTGRRLPPDRALLWRHHAAQGQADRINALANDVMHRLRDIKRKAGTP
jgi:ribulose kinase